MLPPQPPNARDPIQRIPRQTLPPKRTRIISPLQTPLPPNLRHKIRLRSNMDQIRPLSPLALPTHHRRSLPRRIHHPTSHLILESREIPPRTHFNRLQHKRRRHVHTSRNQHSSRIHLILPDFTSRTQRNRSHHPRGPLPRSIHRLFLHLPRDTSRSRRPIQAHRTSIRAFRLRRACQTNCSIRC